MAENNKDLEQDPFSEFGGKAISNNKEEANPFAEFGGSLLEKKKNIPSPSSATKLPSPNQPINPLQQGADIVGGGVLKQVSKGIPQSIGDGVSRDKSLSTWAAAKLNDLVGVIASTGQGLASMQEKRYNTGLESAMNLLGESEERKKKVREDLYIKGSGDQVKAKVESALRSKKSSKEYEEELNAYDIMDGIQMSDIAGLLNSAPAQVANMIAAVPTRGANYYLQTVGESIEELEKTPEGAKMDERSKLFYASTQGLVQMVLEKFAIDKILDKTGLGKTIKADITKRVVNSFVSKGAKATAKQLEDAVFNEVSSIRKKIARNGVNALFGAGTESVTEAAQSAMKDGVKLATNAIQGKEIFDERDIKRNFWKNVGNSAAGGSVFGTAFGGGASLMKNTNKAIRKEVVETLKTEGLDRVLFNINNQVEQGNLTPEEADSAGIKAQQYAEIAGKIPETIPQEKKYDIVGGIEQRQNLKDDIELLKADINSTDEAFKQPKLDQLDLLEGKLGQVNDYIESLVSGVEPRYEQKDGKFYKVIADGRQMQRIEIPENHYIAGKLVEEGKKQQSKQESDAVQEQTAGEVPVQSETTVSEEVEGGKPQTGLKEVATIKSDEKKIKPIVNTESLESGGLKYYISDENGNQVGVAEVSMVDDKIIIDNVFVDEKSKRKGFATSIIDKIIEDFRGRKYEYVDQDNNEFSIPYKIETGTIVSEEGEALSKSVKKKIEDFNKQQELAQPEISQPIELSPELPIEEVEQVKLQRQEAEPPTVEGGRKVATISGLTEEERLEKVEKRKKSTKLTTEEELRRELVDLANSLGNQRGTEKANTQAKIRQKVLGLNAEAGFEKYRFDGVRIRKRTESKTKGVRYMPVSSTSRDISGSAIKDDAVLLTDRSPEFTNAFEALIESPALEALQVDRGDGISMTKNQIESALEDILDGIPSVAADNLLNTLEEGFNRGFFDLRAKDLGIEGTQTVQAMLDEFIGAEKEVVGEPMDEEALLKFLEEESKLESEEDIELLDNIENLITEYESEPTKTITKGEVSSTKTEPETRVTEQPKPTESGKSEGKPKAKVSRQPDEKAEPKGEDVDNPALKDVASTAKALEKFPKPTLIDKIAKLIGGKKFVGSRRRRSDTDIEIERVREIDDVVNVRTSLGVKVKGDEIIFSDGDSLFDKLVSMGFSSNEAATIISAVQDFFPPKSQEFYPDSFKDENPEDINSIIEEEGFKRYINQYLNEENTKRHFSNVEERLNSIEVDDNWYSKKSIDFIKDIFNSVKKGEVFLMTENQLKDLGLSKLKEKQNVNSFDISEAYHKAKKEGSNPELVKAVEELLSEPKKETKPTKEQAEPKPKAVEKKEEAPKKISDKAREQAAKLRSGEANVLPEWLRANLPKGTKKQGIDINEAFANALETFADAYDKLKDFKAAAEKAFKNISDWYSENNIEYNEKELKEKFEDTLLKIQEGKREKEKGTLRMDNKSILNRIYESENISQSVKDKLQDKLKYQVASQEEARKLAKEIIAEFGYEDSVTLAEAGKFSGDVNSMIFAEAIDNAFNNEAKAKTLEDKLKYAEEWKDIVERYDESARDKGRFISAIQDFYKKSPLGIIMLEESKRKERFEDWYKPKEKTLKEVFEAIKEEPEFKELIQKQVQEELKKERAENRKARRSKIEKFFDDAKFKGDALYAVPIPPKVINSGLELMKQAFLAGESVVNSVEVAIDYITKEVGTWDKDKFRKEYEEKLAALESKQKGKTDEELTQEKKERILDKFRNKLKGLSESEKEEVIRKAFKKLVENGALEYQDFKDIIAETLGYGKMTEEEAKRITELVNDINSVETIADEIRQEGNRTIENIKKYKEAKKKAEKSATELAALVYNKPNILKRLLSIMQLNTLGIPSLVNNPLFNIFNQATVRLPIGVQLTALDQIIYGASKIGSKLFGTSVIYPENNILVSQGEFFRKAGEGASESASQLINGLTSRDYFQKEVYASQIQPFTSAKDLWDWKFKGKKLTPTQIADKTIQATVGLPAEVVARLLNIGDKPQRYAAEGAKSAVLAKEFGLGKVDYEYFLEFPKEEAFRYYKQQGLSDEAAMEKAEKTKEAIIKAGDESVFQQDNLLNDAINAVFEASKKYGNVPYSIAQAVKMLNFPYLKIPLNAFWSVYNLVNPEVAFAQSAYYSIKAIKTKDSADIQKAKVWAAHGTTGMALLAIAGGLVAKGIVNSDNDDETTKKERMGEKQYEQQKSINVTKLAALLQGKDPDSVKHGLNVDLKYFANMGSILNTVAIRQENMTKEQKEASADYFNTLFANLSQSSLELIDNGVFSNASALVTAFDRGGNYMDNYLLNLINMAGNIVQPAMFAQHSRAQLPYYSKVKADTFYEEVKNNILARSSVVRALTGKYPPSQIGIWGDKLERKDDLILKWFGMSNVDRNNFAQPIYDDYKKTKNTNFLPPSVKPEIDKQKLTVLEAEKLEILVGNARKALIAPYINDLAQFEGLNKRYSELSEEQKLKVLDILYDLGYQKGKNLFIEAYPKYKKPEEELDVEKVTQDAYMQIFKIIKETE